MEGASSADEADDVELSVGEAEGDEESGQVDEEDHEEHSQEEDDPEEEQETLDAHPEPQSLDEANKAKEQADGLNDNNDEETKPLAELGQETIESIEKAREAGSHAAEKFIVQDLLASAQELDSRGATQVGPESNGLERDDIFRAIVDKAVLERTEMAKLETQRLAAETRRDAAKQEAARLRVDTEQQNALERTLAAQRDAENAAAQIRATQRTLRDQLAHTLKGTGVNPEAVETFRSSARTFHERETPSLVHPPPLTRPPTPFPKSSSRYAPSQPFSASPSSAFSASSSFSSRPVNDAWCREVKDIPAALEPPPGTIELAINSFGASFRDWLLRPFVEGLGGIIGQGIASLAFCRIFRTPFMMPGEQKHF